MKIIETPKDSDIEYIALHIGKTWTTMDAIFEGRVVDSTKYLTSILNPWHVTAVLDEVISAEQKEEIESYIIKKLGLDKKKESKEKKKKNGKSKRSGAVPETVKQAG
jgi:hypothetical protein